LRKETSKAASVLLLRFFHGYYPSEIALLLRTSRQAVDERLRLARSEAKLYLDDPQRLKFIAEGPPLKPPPSQPPRPRATTDFLDELREMIFQSRQGHCLSRKQLRQVYSSAEAKAVDGTLLAHLVSCPRCLDEVNRLLGLPLLADRYPTDM